MVRWFCLNCVEAEQKQVRCCWRSDSRSWRYKTLCPEWGSDFTAAHIPRVLQFQQSEPWALKQMCVHWHTHTFSVTVFERTFQWLTLNSKLAHIHNAERCLCDGKPVRLELKCVQREQRVSFLFGNLPTFLSDCNAKCDQFGCYVSLLWPRSGFENNATN